MRGDVEERANMLEQRSERTKTADASHVEYLLGVLSAVSQHDPPPAIRERLELLSSNRLRARGVSAKQLRRARSGLLPWIRPAFVVALLILIGIAAAFIAHVRQPEHLRAGIESRFIPSEPPFNNGSAVLPASPSLEAKLPKPRHSLLPKFAQSTNSRRMIVRLPYSDSAIDTGTDATIRISMTQAELVSLGFPIDAALRDARVVADLTLGDDGLPRAISVPLPLEVIRGKK